MAGRIREHDWSTTPLGPTDRWSASLKAMVRMALTTRHPMFIFWGKESTCLYNDAYSASLGPEKHPSILGTRGRDAWDEIWPIIGPQIELVLRGDGATWHENQLVPIYRHGAIEDVYWTYSFGPIDDEEAPHGVGGVLVVCTETTAHVMSERRLATEHERLAQLGAAQSALLTSEEQLRLATNAAEVGLWDVDVLTDTLFWPARVKAMFGISPDVPVSMADFYAGLHPDDQACTSAAFSAAMDPSQRSLYDVEYRTIGKEDGVVRWVAAKGRAIFDENDRCIRVLGTAVDITRRKTTETLLRESEAHLRLALDALQDADRNKDTFLATLGHELRNPLSTLRNALTVLGRSGVDPAMNDRARHIMARQIDQLGRLTEDLLDVSRINIGKINLRCEVLALDSVLAQAAECCLPSIERAGQQFEMSMPEAPALVYGDSARLVQVFGNLIGNASKFTPEGGRITVVVRLEGASVITSIEDSGIGLSADTLLCIFDTFTQLENPIGRSNTGLGVGLALSKQLIDMHGGTIEARSAGLGHGSEMIVTLRLQAPTPSPPSNKSQ